jgi:hypothetical protein
MWPYCGLRIGMVAKRMILKNISSKKAVTSSKEERKK